MRSKQIGFISVLLVIFGAIVMTSVVWASYTQTLNINGTGVVKGNKWQVKFEDLSSAETSTDGVGTTWAKELTAPHIVEDTKIETYNVQLSKPGDWVSYKFKIHNSGTFPAKIDLISIPTPTCQKTTGGLDTDATNVCKYLRYTLTYADDPSLDSSGPIKGKSLGVGDPLNAGEARLVELKLYYLNSVPANELPTNDVTISNLGISVNYIQV